MHVFYSLGNEGLLCHALLGIIVIKYRISKENQRKGYVRSSSGFELEITIQYST